MGCNNSKVTPDDSKDAINGIDLKQEDLETESLLKDSKECLTPDEEVVENLGNEEINGSINVCKNNKEYSTNRENVEQKEETTQLYESPSKLDEIRLDHLAFPEGTKVKLLQSFSSGSFEGMLGTVKQTPANNSVKVEFVDDIENDFKVEDVNKWLEILVHSSEDPSEDNEVQISCSNLSREAVFVEEETWSLSSQVEKDNDDSVQTNTVSISAPIAPDQEDDEDLPTTSRTEHLERQTPIWYDIDTLLNTREKSKWSHIQYLRYFTMKLVNLLEDTDFNPNHI